MQKPQIALAKASVTWTYMPEDLRHSTCKVCGSVVWAGFVVSANLCQILNVMHLHCTWSPYPYFDGDGYVRCILYTAVTRVAR